MVDIIGKWGYNTNIMQSWGSITFYAATDRFWEVITGMKANKDFVLRQIADEYLLIPVGEAAKKINGLMCLTESGFLLFQKLQDTCTREELVQCILSEYDVTAEIAEDDVDQFLETLRRFDILEEA